MNGTSSEQAASDQRMPLVRNNLNWMYAPPNATIAAKRMRPARESGVVLGSEIMKNVKSSSAPICIRWGGIVMGSPRHSQAHRRMAPQAPEKPQLAALRDAGLTSGPQRHL